jgi:uncharacterized protein with von Willebrand factor type A (vWA) domain
MPTAAPRWPASAASTTSLAPHEAPTALDTPYHQLATLPRGTWLPVLTAAVGTREARLAHAQAWLAALHAGELPATEADFADPAATAPLRQAVADLRLPALARGVDALGEQVLRTMLWHLDRLVDLQPRLTRAQAIAQAAQAFRDEWTLESQALEPDLALLRDLAGGSHLAWAELRGQLRQRGWQQARRAADRLARLPDVVALIDRLGRREPGGAARPAPAEPAAMPPRRQPVRAVATDLPGAPGEITGIRFDSRIEHMLPSEALWLRHPVLGRLWRARRAEGRLLAHDTSARVVDHRPDPQGRPDVPPPPGATRAQRRGPFVLCLDTSGSMAGAPEHVAKAVAIAALRAAHAAGRACRVVAFGGPGEVVESDLTAGADGLAATLALMAQAFDGGTDVQTPIERAVALVHDAGWHGADLLIVSDGEFGCVRSTLDRLESARRELGLHVQGVLVGDRETMGMLEACDAIHWVRDWRQFAETGEPVRASPVHSKSLTALYFPNALSPQASRHRRGD